MTKTIIPNTQLFFISGMFAGGWIWRDVAAALKQYDQKVMDEPLCMLGTSLEALLENTKSQLSKYDNNSVVLIGNSLGSLVAMILALEMPEKIKGVVISGSAGFGPSNITNRVPRQRDEAWITEISSKICHNLSSIKKEDQETIADLFFNRQSLSRIIRLTRETNLFEAESLLDTLQCPLHVIWGENDVITPLSTREKYFQQRDIPINIIPNCGHSPGYEQNVAFVKSLQPFLEAI